MNHRTKLLFEASRIFLLRQSKFVILSFSLALLAAIVLIDYFTNAELRLTVFYLLPLYMVARYTSTQISIAFALICSAVWTYVNHFERYHSLTDAIPLENFLFESIIFIIFTLLFTHLVSHARAQLELVDKLQKALGEVRQLSGLLPICASCKKIRDDKGYWQQLEVYIRDHSEADFSHGLCPDCVQKMINHIP